MSKKSIIIIISLIGSLILVFVFIEPLWSSVKTLNQEIEQKKLEITTTEEILAKTTELNQEYQNLEEEADKVSLALPEEEDIPRLLIQFENLASANGLLLEAISFTQPSEEGQKSVSGQSSQSQAEKISPPFPSLFLNVKVSGSYGAFKGYLTGLENNIRSMDTHSINFAIQSKEGQESISLLPLGIFEFDLGVSVYYQK